MTRVEPIAILPTSAGCAIFLGDGQKAIVFYTESGIGASINAVLSRTKPPRPLTHDLFSNALLTFGAKVARVVVVKVENEIFYARLFIEAQNEIMERKIVELDARPSDAIALAVRADAPIFFIKEVWDAQKDMSAVLEEMRLEGGHLNEPEA